MAFLQNQMSRTASLKICFQSTSNHSGLHSPSRFISTHFATSCSPKGQEGRMATALLEQASSKQHKPCCNHGQHAARTPLLHYTKSTDRISTQGAGTQNWSSWCNLPSRSFHSIKFNLYCPLSLQIAVHASWSCGKSYPPTFQIMWF